MIKLKVRVKSKYTGVAIYSLLDNGESLSRQTLLF